MPNPPTTATARPVPPMPDDPDDQRRWLHTAFRRRILYNLHEQESRNLAVRQVGARRTDAWKSMDLAVNVAESITGQLAAMYRVAPDIQHDDRGAAEAMRALLERAEIWPLMGRVQRDTLGLRECFLRLDPDPEKRGEVCARIAYPDEIVAKGRMGRPDQPREIREAILRAHPSQSGVAWFWDVVENGALRVLDEQGRDWTEAFYSKSMTGEGYLETYGERLPYQIYRAAKSGQMWCPYDWRGLFDGTVQSVVFRTYFGHCFRQASWPQRSAINLRVQGADEASGGEAVVVSDPAVVLQWEQIGDGNNGKLDQWSPAADPADLLATIGAYERGVITSIGISASDILRTAEDPRSGLALAVSREGQREAQRQWEPLFRASDLQMLHTVAVIHNQAANDVLPETGYRLHYRALPLSATERQAKRQEVLELLDRGLMSKVDAYREFHPNVSDAQAEEALRQIRELNARIS